MPTGQAEPPQTGHTLFSARTPAKIDHHPAKRTMADEKSFVMKDAFAGGAADGGAACAVPPSVCFRSVVFIFLSRCPYPLFRMLCYFSLGKGHAMMPPSMTFTFFQPLPSSTRAAS